MVPARSRFRALAVGARHAAGLRHAAGVALEAGIAHTAGLPRAAGIALAVGITLAAATACSDSPTTVTFDAPVDLALEWRTASPLEAGMDPARMDQALARARAIPRLRSLLVVRRGHLVAEHYFGGAGPEDLADVRSVTKSVVSTLAGIALERGHLSSLDQPIGEILGPAVAALDSTDASVTVRHLLTMSGGWAWSELGSVGYNEWILSGDHLGFLLAKPHSAAPGTTFAYNSAATHLLGVVVEEAVGVPLPRFAAEVLFEPLGIARAAWESMPGGRVNGSAGLDLRPRDLARLGQLMLQEGRSGRSRVLPDGWVALATAAHWPWRSNAGPTQTSYGYLWWTDERNAAFMAWGYGGQFVYVAPGRDLVVVTTTEWRDGAPSDLSGQVLELIVAHVLPAAPPS